MKPYFAHFGKVIHRLPYQFIPFIGRIYSEFRNRINIYERKNENEEKQYIFDRMYSIVKFAIDNIPFYHNYYKQAGFELSQLNSFDDITKIPIVDKTILQSIPLEDRSYPHRSSYKVRTGGSSGQPLAFTKTCNLQVKEMAYYHNAWETLGYDTSKIRLQFVGRGKIKNSFSYDIVKNQFVCSSEMPPQKILEYIIKYNKNGLIEYIQGYPSVIFRFAQYCEVHQTEFTKSRLLDSLKGVFLNSEYPHVYYREYIENIFKVKTIASYGHTEGGALAFDNGTQEYIVEQSYGYTESINIKGTNHLVCTTWDNFASPLIRYDTNDLIDCSMYENHILRKFSMAENGGRNGQFIRDKNGNDLSVTALIFGRHHKLFEYCSQIQLAQNEWGKATVLYVPLAESVLEPHILFDSEGIDIDFTFIELSAPIRTSSGKTLLLVDYKL